MKNTFAKLTILTLTVFLMNACGGGGGSSSDTTASTTVTLSVTQVQPDTTIMVSCDNGYTAEIGVDKDPAVSVKESDDENVPVNDKVELDLPENATCQLLITTDTPCYKTMLVTLDKNDGEFDLSDFYEQECSTPTPTPTPTPMPPPVGMNNGLHDWRAPRVYARVNANPVCNQDKIFSLRPYHTSIDTRFVDYTSTPMYPEGYTLKAVQARNSNVTVDLQYDTAAKKWIHECVPVTYVDKKDIYPSYWVEAVSDANGTVVTKDRIIMYDSGTNNCMVCHASNSKYPLAYAKTGPANLADPEEDYKINILRKHDEEYPDAVQNYLTQLQAVGKDYNPAGLEETSKTMRVSCTDCHGINAVQGSGFSTVPSLTNAIHDLHANLSEPNITGANNCLTCHPGETIAKTFNGDIVHPFTSQWRDEDGHGKWVEDNGVVSCTLCHGKDLRGTKIANNVSCYDCHGKEW
ncbi:hypothetical protein ACM66Z_10460 [Sulfurovum sp. ST-21]|uniref:Cytochrome c7-like domain-containing protein n=1 Tax=Sulfurovum indicum TaxID=2779528 RepID=A0A7M1S3R8_9BACT|nr:hypothetical protein [Sulfurovum indicum]QOR61824.1 hypothetical protein IMZ28_10445 [Sulfurovum indicum]